MRGRKLCSSLYVTSWLQTQQGADADAVKPVGRAAAGLQSNCGENEPQDEAPVAASQTSFGENDAARVLEGGNTLKGAEEPLQNANQLADNTAAEAVKED